MGNEHTEDEDIDIDIDVDEDEDEDADKAKGKDGEPKKPTETPEAKRARLKRQLKQLNKKHGFKDEDDDEDDEPRPKKSSKKKEDVGLDRMDKAILRVEKITHPDDVELVEQIMRETGKDLESVLESKYFKAELADLREGRATEEAVPKGTKRSSQASRDSVQYWLNKGELPPVDQVDLRRKVVQAKIDKEKSGSQFSDNPVL